MSSTIPTPLPTEAHQSRLQPTIVQVDELEDDSISSPSTRSSTSDSGTSQRNSVAETDGIESVSSVENVAPLTRIDLAHEVSLSHWGLIPPKNFARVMPAIFRCSYPTPENFTFLRTFGLKSVLTLVPEPYPPSHARFIVENGLQHFQVGIEPNKDPFVTISQCNISAALSIVLDRSNHPILIHCNKGKHRTGCVVGCFRKILGWDLEKIIEEYRHYAGIKARRLDERFIELFDERAMLWLARLQNYPAIAEPFVGESPIAALSIGSRLRS